MKLIFKRTIALLLALGLLSGMGAALALNEGDARVVIGANLTEEQRTAVYGAFGVQRGAVTELSVSNSEERLYLKDLVDPALIGTRSISCVYVKIGAAGSGLNVSASNINWCTREMYMNALVTAGIDDATVVVSAPISVSGTAALTGIYKAYEDLTGEKISEEVKIASTTELVLTAELADQIGNYDAVTIVNELKQILTTTKEMTDDQVRAEIRRIASEYGVAITEGQINQLLSLCRSLEGLSSGELQKKVESVQETIKKLSEVKEGANKFVEGVKNVLESIGNFFKKLFGG